MRSLSLILPALVLALPGCGVTEVVDRAPDGRVILIRSPQPDADDLLELHAEHGVKTVLNLRGEQPEAGWFQEEREGVEKIGARWVHLPVSGSKTPLPEQVELFQKLVEDPDNWPILVHCQGGIHRTGVMAGLYRVQYQRWKGDRAVEEMEDKYFNWTTRDRDALKRFLWGYRRDPERVLPHQAEGPTSKPAER